MRDSLLRGANTDGGWPYYAGRSSRLEPTCWAQLALAGARPAAGDRDAFVPAPHVRFLTASQRADGLLLEPSVGAEDRPNFAFNGLAALLMFTRPDLVPAAVSSKLVAGLVSAKGIQLTESDINRQDNKLQGWSWIDGTFSWVEPTTWCMIGLEKAHSADAGVRARLTDGERLLTDRCCTPGGWNYGNSNMLGQDLRPYVPTTALGLIAMQDRRDQPCVAKSLAWLKAHALAEQSAMALSLALIALRVFDSPAETVADSLLAQWTRTAFLGNPHLIAMALYALTTASHDGGAFRV